MGINLATLRDGDLVVASRKSIKQDKLHLLMVKDHTLYGPSTMLSKIDFYGHPTLPDTWNNLHPDHEVIAVIGNWNDSKPNEAVLALGQGIVDAVDAAGFTLVKKGVFDD